MNPNLLTTPTKSLVRSTWRALLSAACFIVSLASAAHAAETGIVSGYQYRPWLNFTVDAANIFNEPQQWYVGYKNRLRRHIENFVTVTIGVNGRF